MTNGSLVVWSFLQNERVESLFLLVILETKKIWVEGFRLGEGDITASVWTAKGSVDIDWLLVKLRRGNTAHEHFPDKLPRRYRKTLNKLLLMVRGI
jgi:hypothetical protein